jgi:hypothetical protein
MGGALIAPPVLLLFVLTYSVGSHISLTSLVSPVSVRGPIVFEFEYDCPWLRLSAVRKHPTPEAICGEARRNAHGLDGETIEAQRMPNMTLHW